MELRVVPFDHPDSALLTAEVQLEYVRLYGEADATPIDPGEFLPPTGLFVVGYLDGAPVVCGGWRIHEENPLLSPGDAEIKRMYVTPRARGRGLARALLAELERTAAAAGRTRMVLETGLAQPEAISLYVTSGYTEIIKFGTYRESETNICYGKSLAVRARSTGFSQRTDAPTV